MRLQRSGLPQELSVQLGNSVFVFLTTSNSSPTVPRPQLDAEDNETDFYYNALGNLVEEEVTVGGSTCIASVGSGRSWALS